MPTVKEGAMTRIIFIAIREARQANFTTYQSCRFQKRSLAHSPILYKYGVRHYVCGTCRAGILASDRVTAEPQP